MHKRLAEFNCHRQHWWKVIISSLCRQSFALYFWWFFLSFHSGMQFTTKDQDNDLRSDGSCAVKFKGAWWYKGCHRSNLNGQYLGGPHDSYADGINWLAFRGHHYSLKHSEMKLRPQQWKTVPRFLHGEVHTDGLKKHQISLTYLRVNNRYILLDVLLCSIAEYFYELCRILASPFHFEISVKKKRRKEIPFDKQNFFSQLESNS